MMTEDEHYEMLDALQEGRATELLNCPVDGTLQGVLDTWVQPQHFFDPSVVITLRCGHKVI